MSKVLSFGKSNKLKFILASVLAFIFGGLFLFSQSSSSQAQGLDEWPMFHHDLNHTGYSTSTAPNTNGVLWTYQTGNAVYSSPAVAGGKVYIGSTDYKVYALDATTGEFIWSYQTGSQVAWSSPAVANGKVYIGSRDGYFYALDASTGGLIWSYQTGVIAYSSPAVAGGKVYIGSPDGKVYALDAATGTFVWSYQTGDYVYSSPAVAGGKVYIGSSDGKVYAFADLDSDNDGMPDVYEQAHYCLNPLVPDATANLDDDELNNYAEMVVGTDPCFPNPELALDSDGDGFTDGKEIFIGTDPLDACPDNSSDDAWPPDLDKNKAVTILDVLLYKAKLPPAPYDRRYDLDTNGSVNILDVLLFKPLLGKTCQ